MQKVYSIGKTHSGLPIMAYEFGKKGRPVLILAGVHGDEVEGVSLAKTLVSDFLENFNYNTQLTIIPEFNLDGILLGTRKNANNVDLNRNLPTKDWSIDVAKEKYFPGIKAGSEIENQHLVKLIKQKQFEFIISLHSWEPCLNTNGNCQLEAEILNKYTNYKIVKSIGYPTPGCLGTYTGLERNIPTITYELLRLQKDRLKVEDKNILAIKKVLSI